VLRHSSIISIIYSWFGFTLTALVPAVGYRTQQVSIRYYKRLRGAYNGQFPCNQGGLLCEYHLERLLAPFHYLCIDIFGLQGHMLPTMIRSSLTNDKEFPQFHKHPVLDAEVKIKHRARKCQISINITEPNTYQLVGCRVIRAFGMNKG
jgi:hypothetical protein